jgi:hypothetical protein
MRTHVLTLATLGAALPVVLVGVALAGGGNEVSAVRQATAAYHDIEKARQAGYVTELEQIEAPPYGGGTCIADVSSEAKGAMGIHLVDTREGGRLNGTLEAANPEALLYERRNDGSYKLTGVEYIVAGPTRPELYHQLFEPTNLARYGQPSVTVWTLHAWIWKPNPRGMFDPWNSRVSC